MRLYILISIFQLVAAHGGNQVEKLFAECPFCDPNYVDVPNLQSAMQGYDLPMGDPNRAGSQDPGVRNQIFMPMTKNKKGFMEVDGRFITVNDMIKCDTAWTEEIHHDFESYIKSSMKHTLIGLHLSVGKDLEIPYRPYVSIPITINFKLPTLLSRSQSSDDHIQMLKSFFNKENGSIAVSQAACSTHRVDMSAKASKKTFMPSFMEAIKGLYLASNESETIQDFEFRRFINEFGTHYASRTILGVRLYAERRYSSSEKALAKDQDLNECNTATAIKLVGMQVEPDVEQCKVPQLLGQNFSSEYLQRYVVTTFGSYTFNNSAEWNKQITTMHMNGILFPVPIRRKLRPIIELFFDKNLHGSLKVDDEEVLDSNRILKWFLERMGNYEKYMMKDQQ